MSDIKTRFIRKIKTFSVFTFIWILTCSIAVYLRLYPLRQHTSNDANEKASLLVMSNLRNTIKNTVEDKYAAMPPLKRHQFIQTKFDEMVRENRSHIRQSIFNLARDLDSKNPQAQKYPYLLASDSYYYYGLTENINQYGRISNHIKGSKYLNERMLAPLGHWEPFNLHPYVGFLIHKFISLYKPDMELMFSVSFTPLLLVALMLVPFFFICRHLQISPSVSLMGGIYFICAPIFLKRSMFGWYDNDPYTLLFGFLILTLLFKGLSHGHQRKTMTVYAVITAMAIPLYALFWQGWVFFESVIFISGISIISYNHFFIKDKTATKNLFFFFSIIIVLSFIGISIVFGVKEFFILFQEGWVALMGFTKNEISQWPDLYLAVGELRKADFTYIVEKTGDLFFITVAGWGILCSIKKLFASSFSHNLKFCFIIMCVLMAFATIMGLGARRFVLLFLVPASLFFLIGLENIFRYFKNQFYDKTYKKKIYRFLIALVGLTAFAFIIFMPLWHAHAKIPSLLNQIYNDTWHKTLIKIKQETPPDSIINTWWPPGHFINAMAQRRVSFDGATINTPQAYWMANILMSQNEKSGLGLLRILNNSANQATEYLQDTGLKLSQIIPLLKNISTLNYQQAADFLKEMLAADQIKHLLSLTHKEPPPSYLFLYNELVDKNIQLPFVAYWDFAKMERFNDDPKYRQLVPSPSSKPYINFLWKLAGGHPKYSGLLKPVDATPQLLIFQDNIKVNVITKECSIDSPKYGKGIPHSIFYVDEGRIIEKKYPHANLRYSIVLINQNGQYGIVLMDTRLARSLIMQLYFLEGEGLKYIKPYYRDGNLTGRTQIDIYEIDWKKYMADLENEGAAL